jgi:hypothetical protein
VQACTAAHDRETRTVPSEKDNAVHLHLYQIPVTLPQERAIT